jgi:signal peptidase I
MLAAGVLAAAIRRQWLVVTVRGASMSPTLRSGERVLARRNARWRTGSIVVFRWSKGRSETRTAPVLVKRVAAVPGEPFPAWARGTAVPRWGEATRVPQGYIVVAGDGDRSSDSRDLGLVPTNDVIGTVVLRLGGSSDGTSQ